MAQRGDEARGAGEPAQTCDWEDVSFDGQPVGIATGFLERAVHFAILQATGMVLQGTVRWENEFALTKPMDANRSIILCRRLLVSYATLESRLEPTPVKRKPDS